MSKYIFILTFWLTVSSVIGQDTIYLNKSYKEVKSIKEASFYKVVQKLKKNRILEKSYETSGQIKTEIEFKLTRKGKMRDGTHKTWYKTGELKAKISFKENKIDGEFLTYWKNRNLKRKDIYKKGKFKKGSCWNEKGDEIKYFSYEIPASYVGGKRKMIKHIKDNMKYPKISKKHKIGGVVIVNFTIDEKGKVINAEVVKGVNYEIDNEALRIINMMPLWNPALLDGEAVKTRYRLPLMFNPKLI